MRAIHGAEIDVALDTARADEDRWPAPWQAAPTGRRGTRHLTLLVRDERGWSNLCRIITLAHAHTREGTARRERSEPWVTSQAVIEHAEGLVCLTGCAQRSVMAGAAATTQPTARDCWTRSAPRACTWSCSAHTPATTVRATAPARRGRGGSGVRCVATGDVHAHTRARAELQDAFVALAHHATLDASEPLRRGNHSHVMSTPRAMASRFADHPEAVA